MGSRGIVQFAVSALVVAGSLVYLACKGEVTDLVPEEYVLCIGVLQPGDADGWVGIFDCTTDSLADSLGYPGMHQLLRVNGSPRGDFLSVIESGRPTRIWDLRSRTQVAQLRVGGRATFALEPDLLLLTDGQSATLYTTSPFEEDTSVALRLIDPVWIPGSSRVLGVKERGPTDRLGDLSQLIIFDLEAGEIVDSLVVRIPGSNDSMQVWSLDVSSNGTDAYVVASDLGGWAMRISLTTHEVIFRTALVSSRGNCRLNPDANELWVTDPGLTPLFGDPVWPGHILILDATTGAVLDTVSTLGIDSEPGKRLQVDDIEFVPGLGKSYINGRPYSSKQQPVLVIDTRAREIVRVIFPEFNRTGYSISVVPRY